MGDSRPPATSFRSFQPSGGRRPTGQVPCRLGGSYSVVPCSGAGPAPWHPGALPGCYTPRVKLTVTVITRNEAANIEGALESVKWADEIVVVDSHSADETVALAGRYAARIVVHDWAGYSAQRNYAAEIASHDWILAIDADERVPPELASRDSANHARRVRRRRLSHATRLVLPRTLDSRHRLVPRLSAAALRSARGPLQRQARARVGRAEAGPPGHARARPAALPLPRHLGPRHEHRSLHDARGRGVVRRGPPRRIRSRPPCIRPRRSCGTTSSAAASGTAPPAS